MKFEDGRQHIAKWSEIFVDDNTPIDKDTFAEKVLDLKFDMPLGPNGFLTAKQAIPSDVNTPPVPSRAYA